MPVSPGGLLGAVVFASDTRLKQAAQALAFR
jgi:hypothetical protein